MPGAAPATGGALDARIRLARDAVTLSNAHDSCPASQLADEDPRRGRGDSQHDRLRSSTGANPAPLAHVFLRYHKATSSSRRTSGLHAPVVTRHPPRAAAWPQLPNNPTHRPPPHTLAHAPRNSGFLSTAPTLQRWVHAKLHIYMYSPPPFR